MKINIKDVDKWINTDGKFEKFKPKTDSPGSSDLKKGKKKIKSYKNIKFK